MIPPRRRTTQSGRSLALAGMFALGLAAGVLVGPQVTMLVSAAPAGSPTGAEARPATIGASPASGSIAGAQLERGLHPAEVVRVLDGDTFEARVHVWPGIDVTTKVRLRGIDAPELRARCADERSKAEAAREALRAMLAEGEVAVTHVGLDKYGGRVLADAVTRRTPDVGTAMLVNGHARPYAGGRREPWCAGSPADPE
jgi:endonuclease YncB( thermonuclease family)